MRWFYWVFQGFFLVMVVAMFSKADEFARNGNTAGVTFCIFCLHSVFLVLYFQSNFKIKLEIKND